MTREIHQEESFDVTPQRFYEALMDSIQHAAFTGAPAEIGPEVGSAFSAHGGYISGINVVLIPGKRIVQAWRAASWDPDDYSIVRFELSPEGTGTKMVLDHFGFPEGTRSRCQRDGTSTTGRRCGRSSEAQNNSFPLLQESFHVWCPGTSRFRVRRRTARASDLAASRGDVQGKPGPGLQRLAQLEAIRLFLGLPSSNQLERGWVVRDVRQPDFWPKY